MQPLTRSRPRPRFFGTSGPSFALDFVNGTNALDPRVTFTRASSATFFNSAGVLTSAAIDVPRFDYNPSTLAAQGLLIEEARTNEIQNNTMQGAVAGTVGSGGAIPTDWTVPDVGMTVDVALAIENGVSCVDITWSGTAAANNARLAFATTLPSASDGQNWTGSTYLKLQAGTYSELIQGRITGPGVTLDQTGSIFAVDSTLKRFQQTRLLSGGFTTVQFVTRVSLTIGASYNFTLRIGLPQLELGAFATSVIPTTTTALTRAADVASVNTLSPWYSATEGTIYAESLVFNISNQRITSFNDGSSSNRMLISRGTGGGGNVNATVTNGGSPQVSGLILESSLPAQTSTKAAFAYKLDDFAGSVNGSAAVTDTSGTIPTVNILALGSGEALGTNSLNGYLRRITYYPRRLSNAQLQAITA